MKTIIKSGIFFLILGIHSFGAWAQESKGSIFSLSLKGGVNLSSIETKASSFSNFIDQNKEQTQGFVFGASARLGRKFFIQPEVLVSQKGGNFGVKAPNVNASYDLKFTSVDVPILFGLRLGRLHFLGGPVAGYRVQENEAVRDALKTYYSYVKTGDVLSKSTLSYQVGAGITLLGLTLDVRYEGGLTNLLKDLNLPSNIQLEQRPSLIQATLGFKLL